MTIYMKIDGIEGDVSTKGYEKWIEIEEIDWNLSRSIRSKPGLIADREATKPAISDLIIKKIVDRTTPHTLCESCVGKAKSVVKIHFCQTGDTLSSYMEFTLNNVLFSNYTFKAVKGAEDAHSTMETISMNFDKVEVKYIPYDATHRPGSPILTGYDLATATKV